MKRTCCLLLLTVLGVSGCAAPKPVFVRVLSYNIHHGEGVDRKLDLPRIAELIRAANPDLVALQEVDRGVRRTGGVDQPAELGRLTGMRPLFEKNINFQGGEYGNAILTRLPVVEWRNHYLPQSLPAEQRGMLEARVRTDLGELIFFATHFDYHPDEGERLASAEMCRRLVRERGDVPIILAGDLNALPESRTITQMLSFMRDSFQPAATQPFTFPADEPVRRIDYILYTPHPRLRRVSWEVIPEATASDHRPVLAVFELSAAR